jgi:hypothetical protein
VRWARPTVCLGALQDASHKIVIVVLVLFVLQNSSEVSLKAEPEVSLSYSLAKAIASVESSSERGG